MKKVEAAKFMMQTIEAVIDEKGKIHLLEPVKLETAHRALVTILPSSNKFEKQSSAGELAGLGEILDDDLESASREIAAKFKNALNSSAQELEN
jgi:hypothetical protein